MTKYGASRNKGKDKRKRERLIPEESREVGNSSGESMDDNDETSPFRDPMKSSAFEDSSETMQDDMNAIRKLFKHISDKKVQQKKQRSQECRQTYLRAFDQDVTHKFRQAKRERKQTIEELNQALENEKMQITQAVAQLYSAEQKYSTVYAKQIQEAQSNLTQLNQTLVDLESSYHLCQNDLAKQFDALEDQMEQSLESLQSQLYQTCREKTYLEAFHPQLHRLL